MRTGTVRTIVASLTITTVALATLLGPGATVMTAGGMDMMESKTGDLNADGVANSIDALLVLFHDAGLGEPPTDIDAWTAIADVDCDLEVTALDAALILQADAGLYQLRT